LKGQRISDGFREGQGGNPARRPPGSRNKLMQSFVADLQEKRLTNGTPILERLATDDPAKLVEAISRFAPKDVAAKQWEARITM
jgi:hypothetical protein